MPQTLQQKLSRTILLVSDHMSCPQVLKMRSYALDSSVPAVPVHISSTYPILGVPSGEVGVLRGWGAGMAENGWWVALFVTAS